jgi:hypothetical protein
MHSSNSHLTTLLTPVAVIIRWGRRPLRHAKRSGCRRTALFLLPARAERAAPWTAERAGARAPHLHRRPTCFRYPVEDGADLPIADASGGLPLARFGSDYSDANDGDARVGLSRRADTVHRHRWRAQRTRRSRGRALVIGDGTKLRGVTVKGSLAGQSPRGAGPGLRGWFPRAGEDSMFGAAEAAGVMLDLVGQRRPVG